MIPARVLLVDDDGEFASDLTTLLGPKFEIVHAPAADAALRILENEHPFQAALVDVNLGGGDTAGLEVLAAIKEKFPWLPVVMISQLDPSAWMGKALDRGALSCVGKRAGVMPFSQAIRQALQFRGLDFQRTMLIEERVAEEGALVGESEGMREVKRQVRRAIQNPDQTVLLLGETGAGKDVVAWYIHSHSRPGKPFEPAEFLGLGNELGVAALRGARRGAFTGAENTPGVFVRANGGTVFLNDLQHAPLPAQEALLRIVERREVTPLGGNQAVKFDVRLIAATNEPPEQMIEAGKLRHDLYYRLKGLTIYLPPLRERMDDLPILVGHFAALRARKRGREPAAFTRDALQLLRQQDWPGNVRDLRTIIELAIDEGPGEVDAVRIGRIMSAGWGAHGPRGAAKEGRIRQLDEVLREAERRALLQALDATRWNKARAARLLGIPAPTLSDKLLRHGLRGPGEPSGSGA